MDTSIYPIDTATLVKGDYISPEAIGRLLSAERGTPPYAFGLMRLKEHIERGRPDLVVKVDHDGIRVLTDMQATDYADNEAARGFAYAARSLARLMRVDVSQLDDETKQTHDRRLYVRSKQVQAVAQTGKVARVEWRPGLPWKSDKS